MADTSVLTQVKDGIDRGRDRRMNATMKSGSLRHRSAGASLVEVLVGLAIGLLAVLVIYQVFAVF